MNIEEYWEKIEQQASVSKLLERLQKKGLVFVEILDKTVFQGENIVSLPRTVKEYLD